MDPLVLVVVMMVDNLLILLEHLVKEVMVVLDPQQVVGVVVPVVLALTEVIIMLGMVVQELDFQVLTVIHEWQLMEV